MFSFFCLVVGYVLVFKWRFEANQSRILGLTSPSPLGQTGVWNLIFSDEFDGSSLDTTKWVPAFPWGNTSSTTPLLAYRPENVIESNGTLKLIAKKENYLNSADGKTYPYTSGMISSSTTTNNFNNATVYKFMGTYGYMEMRAKLPQGQGLWPAFWTLPAAGKWPPEIDAMEYLGNDPTSVHLHYHYATISGATTDFGTSFSGPDYSADFHTFAVNWQPNVIIWYVDGIERNRFVGNYVTSNPLYLIANFQIGGAWPGNPNSTTVFPATYEIDYIRYWQQGLGPTIMPSVSAPVTNQLLNPSFENTGMAPWSISKKNSAKANLIKDITTKVDGQNSAKIIISKNSATSWDIQFVQGSLSLVSGQTYHLTFWAKASAIRIIPIVVQQNISPYLEYFRQNVGLSTSWQKYDLSFVAPVSYGNTKLSFALASDTGQVWIDNVSFGN